MKGDLGDGASPACDTKETELSVLTFVCLFLFLFKIFETVSP